MNKKYLFAGLLLLALLCAAAFYSFRYAEKENERNVRGQHTFAVTRQNTGTLQQIKMTTPEDGPITVYFDGEVWRFKEAADYFAGSGMLAEFYAMINDSLIMAVSDGSEELFNKYRLQPAAEEYPPETQGTTLETFDADGNLLDKVIIGSATENPEYRFARREGKPFVYSISKVRGFSGRAMAWLPFPLLEIHRSIISAVERDGVRLDAETLETIYPQSEKLRTFLSALSYIVYQDIMTTGEFEQDFAQIKPRRLEVETVVGLIYALDIYKIADTYWLGVTLKSKRVVQKEVPEFIAENQKYFKDWIFQLDDEGGKILYTSGFKAPQKK